MNTTQTFYSLGSPGQLRHDLSVNSVYGSIEWYRTYKDAESKGISFEPIYCKLDPRHRRGGKRLGNLQLILPTSKLSDFMWTWMGPVVTKKVLELFNYSGFTGYEALPATIIKMRNRRRSTEIPIPEVWELKITGKGGDAHPDSDIRVLYVCPECGYTRYSSFQEGIIVDNNKWDGTDFFTVNGYPLFFLIAKRVKDLIVDNKLTNCAIIKTEDLRWGDIPRPEDHPENFVPTRVTMRT